jgi:pimeloyl-ACP methyl ester carboxylesterase
MSKSPGMVSTTERALHPRVWQRAKCPRGLEERKNVTSFVTSLDATRIAYDREGEGEPLILVSGILCDREKLRPLARELARRFSVINYDRRGRGESGDAASYSIEREVEDIGALIAAAGGAASVYGHSSGACLALNAAARALPIRKLVVHEPPYGPDDEESRKSSRDLAEQVLGALAAGRGSDAIRLFLSAAGMPPEVAEGMSNEPKLCSMAPTMAHDYEIVGEMRGGTIPEALVRSIRVPALVIAGEASPEFFRVTAARVAELLPNAKYTVLEGQDHGAAASALAPVVTRFLTS